MWQTRHSWSLWKLSLWGEQAFSQDNLQPFSSCEASLWEEMTNVIETHLAAEPPSYSKQHGHGTEVAEVGVYLWIQESYAHCYHSSDNWVIGTNSKQAVSQSVSQSVSVTRETQRKEWRETYKGAKYWREAIVCWLMEPSSYWAAFVECLYIISS